MTVDESVLAKYEMTIGIESHVQLGTVTKLFSPADNDARDKAPNAVVHPIDYGLPGMLPVLNRKAVDYAIKAAKAMNARVAPVSPRMITTLLDYRSYAAELQNVRRT